MYLGGRQKWDVDQKNPQKAEQRQRKTGSCEVLGQLVSKTRN